MGLFNYIKISKHIPLPDFPENLDQHTINFQTKDLDDNAMLQFIVDYDKRLRIYKEEGEWVDNPDIKFFGKEFRVDKTSWEPYDFTGEIHFYDSYKHPEDDNPIFTDEYEWFRFDSGWIEYIAHFWKGELMEVELFKHEKPHKKSDQELEELRIHQENNRRRIDGELKDNRKNNPSPEQRLIDDIDNIVNYDNVMMSSDDFYNKLRKINDKISTYRTKYDHYYER